MPARKRFGQHFLHDPGVIGRIVRAVAPRPGEALVEIGPGRGALTGPLLATGVTLTAVEIDRDLVPRLAAQFGAGGQLTLHQADALQFDFAALAHTLGAPLRLVGNLPYNISTPLLFHLLAQRAQIADMHFMLQQEVVQRMAAAPGGKDYGRLTVMLAAHCTVEPLFRVPAGAFTPPPKVDSAVVRLLPHTTPPFQVDAPDLFAALVAAAFTQRRKTLRNALREWLPAEAIAACEVDPATRPERVSPARFARLANAVAARACDDDGRRSQPSEEA